ncbi:NAD(P)-dependent oxidoreductase|nr:NAD(P)-dependent oxidoreductase [Candidatus Pantoea persica]
MDALTKGLSLEVAAQGIRVNSVRPGFIYTAMHADGGEPGRVDRVAAMAGVIPMGRGGEAASYVTGSFIDAAGGR